MGGGNSNFDKNAHEGKLMRETIKKQGNKIRNQDFETLCVIDRYGDIVGEVDGSGHSVRSDELDELARGNIEMHNHPNEGTFSPSDVLKHIENGSLETHVVSRSWNYLIRPKGGRHPEYGLRFYQAYREADDRLHKKAEMDFIMQAKDNPEMWSQYDKWVLKRWDDYCHEWLQNNASKYGYEYRRTSVKGRKK